MAKTSSNVRLTSQAQPAEHLIKGHVPRAAVCRQRRQIAAAKRDGPAVNTTDVRSGESARDELLGRPIEMLIPARFRGASNVIFC